MGPQPLNPATSTLKSLKKNELYYHPGGDMIIIIGDESFRTASHFFTRESRQFKERFAAEPNGATPGAKNAGIITQQPHTIIIEPEENVTPRQFEKLCWVFFNRTFGVYDAPLDTWKTILRLANQWEFSEVKDLAFRQLNAEGKFAMSTVDRITLYQEHKAESKYLEPLYTELLTRPTPLSLQEGNALGMKTVLLISSARERLRPTTTSGPLPATTKDAVAKAVKTILTSLSSGAGQS